MVGKYRALLLPIAFAVVACEREPAVEYSREFNERFASINDSFVFADMHSHPSRFHRANVESITPEEIELYKANGMHVVVANISSDMAFSGGYTNRDGLEVERGRYRPQPGEAFDLAVDRLQRLQTTFDQGIAVFGENPAAVRTAKANGEVAIIPALEGADALEGDIDHFHLMYANGLRLIQLVHFRANELGHIQTYPYSPGGLTDFGRLVVSEANRLGVVIDLAHANTDTIMDVLEVSEDPVIFSHGGLKAIHDQDRALTDEEVRKIAAAGGVIGIWPNGSSVPDISTMVDLMEHIVDTAGIEHVGIGSDLRGMSTYSAGFDETAEFRAIANELMRRERSDEEIGRIMGGNFFRVWRTVAETDDEGE
jgi:membrane dipeptidase